MKVDIDEAMRVITSIRAERIPRFLELYNQTMALQARTLMVQFSSSPYIERQSGDLVTGIDIFKLPDGFIVGPTVYYAKWVYGGHRNIAWGHDTGRRVRARPAHIWAKTMLLARQPGIVMACAEAALKEGK
jgi:hypothetical protein